MKIKIVEEIKNLIPALHVQELELLEESILKEGVRDPLVLWGDTLIDGHNRYAIAQKHNLEFKTINKEFEDINQVKFWVIENQLGRRNLSPNQMSRLRGTKYNMEKQTHGGIRQVATVATCSKTIEKQGDKVAPCSKTVEKGGATLSPPSKTSEKIAAETGVSSRTIKRDSLYAAAFDKVSDIVDINIIESEPRGDVITLSKKPVEEQKEIISVVKEKNISIKDAIKKVKKEKKIEEQQNKLIEVGKTYNSDDIKIIHGDFVEKCADIEPNSVDLILTDLPYPKEYLNLWSELSLIAERVLKPSGFCISYSGQLYLLEVMNRMAEHLNYYWQICFHHVGPTNLVHARNVVNEQKPILVYQKAPFKKAENVFVDIIDSDSRDKDLHEWQQGETGFKILLEGFSSPGDLVLEPCAGAGTVPYCCKQLKRRCIAIEIDKKYVDICKGRLS